MCPSFSSYAESLVNQNSSVSDAARGLRSGSIARAGQSWRPAETANVSTPVGPGLPELPELVATAEDSEFAFDSDLQGQWQGTGHEAANFQPSQLSFGLREKNQQFAFSQNLKQDLKPAASLAPQAQAENGTYTAGTLHFNTTAQFNDAIGQEWLTLEQSIHLLDSGEYERSGLARYQATEAIQVSGEWASNTAHQSRSLGIAYQPASPTPDAPSPLSMSLQCTQAETEGQKKEGQNLHLQYDQNYFSYAHENSRVTTGPQSQQEIGLGGTYQALSFALNPKEAIAEFLSLDAQGSPLSSTSRTQTTGANLKWQLNEKSQIDFIHSREVLSAEGQAPIVNESNQMILKHTFNPENVGELSYINTPQQSQFFSGKWTYTPLAEDQTTGLAQWEWTVERQRHQQTPDLNQTHYQLSYASQSLNDAPLGIECQVAVVERPQQSQWDGNLRLYGTDTQAAGFEAILSVGSETPTMLKLNYSQDF